MSLRAIINNEEGELGESLSVDNPVSDEINVELDMHQLNNSLYEVIDNSIFTISSIQELDRVNNWLSNQVDDASSNQSTIKGLTSEIMMP